MENGTNEYAHILSAIPRELKAPLCDKLRDMGVTEVLDKTGMTMMSAVDCFDTVFHVGEVLSREARVAVNDNYGWGMCLGDSPEDAFIIAAADTDDPAVCDEIADFLQEHTAYRYDQLARDRGIRCATKVNFGLMTEG
jgi:hypothetical protein